MHFVNGNPIRGPFDPGLQQAVFGLGCFWGAERRFWETEGVFTTAVGYAGGTTPDPDYQAAIHPVDPDEGGFEPFDYVWEQGNDIGTQYRSAIYTIDESQDAAARSSLDAYQQELAKAGYGPVTTEIKPLDVFYYAEEYHQQYLAKNPNGYCGLGGTGVTCPAGPGLDDRQTA